jgi:hypothetical protein
MRSDFPLSVPCIACTFLRHYRTTSTTVPPPIVYCLLRCPYCPLYGLVSTMRGYESPCICSLWFTELKGSDEASSPLFLKPLARIENFPGLLLTPFRSRIQVVPLVIAALDFVVPTLDPFRMPNPLFPSTLPLLPDLLHGLAPAPRHKHTTHTIPIIPFSVHEPKDITESFTSLPIYATVFGCTTVNSKRPPHFPLCVRGQDLCSQMSLEVLRSSRTVTRCRRSSRSTNRNRREGYCQEAGAG